MSASRSSRAAVQAQPAGANAGASAGWHAKAARAAAWWAPTAGRVLLGFVLAWFGYHELVEPALWTGYVPAVGSTSTVAVILVLAHGWLLFVLAVALIAGIWTRAAAGVAALLLTQIVIWLIATAGLSDLTMRDVGVLGLAVCLTGATEQRFTLTS